MVRLHLPAQVLQKAQPLVVIKGLQVLPCSRGRNRLFYISFPGHIMPTDENEHVLVLPLVKGKHSSVMKLFRIALSTARRSVCR